MLRKFLTYELKTSSRQFLPMYAFYVLFSIVNMFFFEKGFLSLIRNDAMPDTFSLVSVIISSLYLFCMVAVYVLTYVFITIHFYKTMAGKQGYFTFSLPIKPSVILGCKMLIAVFWQLVTCGLILLSIYVLCSVHGIENWIHILFKAFHTIYDHGGYYQTFQILFTISLILTLFLSPLQIFTSIAIGQLFSKNRIAWSICFYFVIYTIMQVLGTILLIVTNFAGFVSQFSQNLISAEQYTQYMIRNMQGSILLSILSGIIMYVVFQYIYTKKLNLV